ncbi:MAG TPA: YbaB/EbfC family nucleoid-associated protein [Anaeromyxobacteraceae bacterium]|nr:YbaB/EbfC family nucleoid-associated protein [Anaeromyxobacteraceae bacterium]
MAGFDIQHLMRQARKLEKAMADARASLDQIAVEAESGGGLVKVRMDGRCTLQKIEIDPRAVDPAERSMLEDLVVAAVNAAAEKARTAADEHVQKATGGIKVPGLPY